MTHSERLRLEVLAEFEGLSVFDRGGRPGESSTIGYALAGWWLNRGTREKKAKKPRASRAMYRPTRKTQSPDERLAARAGRERAKYQAMSAAERTVRNSKIYASLKSDAARLAHRRAYGRQAARDLRSSGRSQYQRLSTEERKARNAAVYASKKNDPAKLARKRAENREYMRRKRSQEK